MLVDVLEIDVLMDDDVVFIADVADVMDVDFAVTLLPLEPLSALAAKLCIT